MITRHYSAERQTDKQPLTTSKNWIKITFSNFPCHLKVDRDKLALINRLWKCKEAERLTITANSCTKVDQLDWSPPVSLSVRSSVSLFVSQSVRQSFSQSTSQSVSQSVRQSVSQLVSQSGVSWKQRPLRPLRPLRPPKTPKLENKDPPYFSGLRNYDGHQYDCKLSIGDKNFSVLDWHSRNWFRFKSKKLCVLF